MIELVNADALRAEVARLVRAELASLRPELVTQKSIGRVVGIPKRDFLRAALAGRFPTFTPHENRRLICARTSDAVDYMLANPRWQPANDVTRNDRDAALRRVGARRVA